MQHLEVSGAVRHSASRVKKHHATIERAYQTFPSHTHKVFPLPVLLVDSLGSAIRIRDCPAICELFVLTIHIPYTKVRQKLQVCTA